MFQLHGMKDDVIPYEGGPSPVGHDFVSAEETVRLWAEHNRCQPDPQIATTASGNRRIEYVGCADGVRVVHYGLPDGDHDVPDELGDGDTLPVTWEFFKSL